MFQRQPRHFPNHGFGDLFRFHGKHAPRELRHRRFIHGRTKSLGLHAKKAKRKNRKAMRREKTTKDNAETPRALRLAENNT
jgi:hypothetical protein